MASLSLFIPILLKHEGGAVDDPVDKGGKTNKGITLTNWKAMGYDKDGDGDIDWDDLKIIDDKDVYKVVYKHYWGKWQADLIKNQSVAELLVDWTYNSGNWGILIPQRILLMEFKQDVITDGIVGPKTIEAVNRVNQKIFFESVRAARLRFVDGIVGRDHTQKRFLRGWKIRIESFKYKCDE